MTNQETHFEPNPICTSICYRSGVNLTLSYYCLVRYIIISGENYQNVELEIFLKVARRKVEWLLSKVFTSCIPNFKCLDLAILDEISCSQAERYNTYRQTHIHTHYHPPMFKLSKPTFFVS
uniref:Uncharacterized protein n=1 Tax=Cacopsylla melanoneura TaxID=428564 RepID=A0A8D8Q7P4_9HEMI